MMRRLAVTCLFLSVALALVANSGAAQVVISQVYGGGGNGGATYRNDFVELFNRGTTTVNLTGWTVQYASASGSSWDRTSLSGTIAPGRYYLVHEYRGSGGTTDLPAADAVGSINLNAETGKVALVAGSVSTRLMLKGCGRSI